MKSIVFIPINQVIQKIQNTQVSQVQLNKINATTLFVMCKQTQNQNNKTITEKVPPISLTLNIDKTPQIHINILMIFVTDMRHHFAKINIYRQGVVEPAVKTTAMCEVI